MKNKKNIFTLCLALVEILMFVFLFLPIVEINVEKSPYIFYSESFTGFDIINQKGLTMVHSIAMVIETVFLSISLLLVAFFAIQRNKKILTLIKISTFFKVVASFFFLVTFNFVGFIFEMLVISSYVLVLLLQKEYNSVYENEHSGFKNTVIGLILMILLFLIIGMDAVNVF